MNMLAAMSWGQTVVCLLMIGICLLLILVVLLQRGRGGGLTGAFGGGGGSAAFGAKTGDVFTWITIVMAGVFIMFSAAANFMFDESPAAPGSAVLAAPADGETPADGEIPSDGLDLDKILKDAIKLDGAIDNAAADNVDDTVDAAANTGATEAEEAVKTEIDKAKSDAMPGADNSSDKPTGDSETTETPSGDGNNNG